MLRRKARGAVEVNPTYVGYARVSTEEQNLQMQRDALIAAGVSPNHIHEEKRSARAKRRPELDAALLDCNPGDTLVVWRLDRFGRDMLDLLRRLEAMEAAGIKFRSLTENFDTSTPMGRAFMGMSAVFAQFESDMTRARTTSGIAAAQRRGVRFGRIAKIRPEQYRELLKMLGDGKSTDQIAKHYRVSRQTVYVTLEKARAAKRRNR